MRISWTKKPLAGSVLAEAFPDLWRFASDDETAIIYRPDFREFCIPVLDGGSSAIVIRHDPWSGKPLPSSLRHRWFDEIDQRGLAEGDRGIPAEFKSELWWVEREL